MTAEIAVMNNEGIALAADSAVTIGKHKTFNTANKLFTLSKYKPVGILFYGKTSFNNTPWETIVKIFRERMGIEEYNYIEDYASEFINFLELFVSRNEYNVDIENQEKESIIRFTYDACSSLGQELLEKVYHNIDEVQLDDESINSEIHSYIENELRDIDKKDFIEEFNEDDVQLLSQNHKDIIKSTIENYFDDRSFVLLLRYLNDDLKEKISDLILNQLVKKFSNATSGIVIAGFGERELYPAVSSFTIDGWLNNKIKYKQEQQETVDEDTSASILPYAQTEMVHTFFKGIDPNLDKFSKGYLIELLEGFPDRIIEELSKIGVITEESSKDDLKSSLDKQMDKILKDYLTHFDEYKHRLNQQPILNIVSTLPKDVLGEMAETLVNLTSFKRKVSSDTETVGGPIDVAVITKGDGFVWMKRKHYFDPELNHHFFENYLNNRRDLIGSEQSENGHYGFGED